MYVNGNPVMRKVQHWRPYICPFEELIPFVPQGARILDVGCGRGLFLALLCASGNAVHGIGIDSSAPAIACAREMERRCREQRFTGQLEFHLRAVEEAWPDGTFDVV